MHKRLLLAFVCAAFLACGCQSQKPPGAVQAELAQPADMVLVPAGSFIMGSDDGQLNERPRRTETLADFFIDIHEVTNEDYSKFLLAKRPQFLPPPGWTEFPPPKGKEKYPVANVTAYEADAYAKWAGKRLPTEAEWEKAARGKDGRLYPWGDRWDPTMGAATVALRPVDQFPKAASPYGCFGLAGNAREWTGSPYTVAMKSEPGIPVFLTPFVYVIDGITLKTKYAKQVATLESMGGVATDDRVVKGGPYYLRSAFECRASFRESVEASTRDETVGFRCAKDAR